MNVLLLVVEVLAAVMGVIGAPVPGVTVVNETLSCCSDLQLPIAVGCLNTFIIDDSPKAQVDKRGDSTVQGPFKLHEGLMEVQDCQNFTVEVTCDVGKEQLNIKISHILQTPCPSAPDGAALLQGSLLFVLLPLTMMMMMMMMTTMAR